MPVWNNNLTTAYEQHNILNRPEFIYYQQEYFRQHCLDKDILELGGGNGNLGDILKSNKWVNVDPYSNSDHIIKQDAISYLENCSEKYDLVITCFSLHHFMVPNIKTLISKVLKPGGYFINSQISPQSEFFGNEHFNRLFFSRGFPTTPTISTSTTNNFKFHEKTEQTITLKLGYQEMLNFIRQRSWSNLVEMSPSEVSNLISYLPNDLSLLNITVIREIMYGI